MTTFTPDESPPKPPRPKPSPPKPDPESRQGKTRNLSLPAKVCSQCHQVKSLDLFMRSAKDNRSNEFNLKEMKACNRCAFDEHNKRATREHKAEMPKSERMQKQLSEEEYARLYGAEAVIKEKPIGVKRATKDDEDGDDAECAPS